MATVDVSRPLTSATHSSKFGPNVRLPYLIERQFDVADFVTAKGSALAAADVIDLISIPKDSVILHAWVRKDSAMLGTTADLTVSVGTTGANPAFWTSAFAWPAAAVGAYATPGTGYPAGGQLLTANTKISLLIAAQTGTWTGGKFRLQVLVIDLSDKKKATIAQLAS